MMQKLPMIRRAAALGVIIELFLCVFSVVYVLTGGIGPCGPTRDVPGFVRLFHQPGFWLAGLLVGQGKALHFLLSLATTAMMFSVLAYMALRILHEEPEERIDRYRRGGNSYSELRSPGALLAEDDRTYDLWCYALAAQRRAENLPSDLNLGILRERRHAFEWMDGNQEWDEVTCDA